jgi:hypothetical protein
MSTIPGHDFYGGATVMRLSDANGVPYMSCNTTRHSDGLFAFRVFKGPNLEEVPLAPVCTGRGSINLGGWWVAANGKEWFNGPIPGFAPVSGHDARVDALISQLAELGGRVANLEAALANVGSLDPKDRTALDRLRTMLML